MENYIINTEINDIYQAQESETEKHLTVKEVSVLLGITERWARQMAKEGIIPSFMETKNNRSNYKFLKADVEVYIKRKESYSSHRGTEQNSSVPSSVPNQKTGKTFSLYPSQVEILQNKILELHTEAGRWQGLYQGKDEQIRQIQNILTERAESLFEKEAKIKELEHKIQKLVILEEEKKRLEEETCRIREEAERAKKDHQDERLKVENERKEKEELMKQLILLNMPWWKKFFHTKEKLEEEARKLLKQGSEEKC